MLQSLNLKNFTCWADTGSIQFAPITIFFGANSSGKSSLLHFLLMLKQTTESRDRTVILKLGGTKADYVDLGRSSDIIYGFDPERRLSFSVKWSGTDSGGFVDPFSEVGFSAKVGLHQKHLRVEQLSYHQDGIVVIEWTEKSGNCKLYFDDKHNELPLKAPTGLYTLEPRIVNESTPAAIGQFALVAAGYLRDFSFALEQLFKKIFYIGPLREDPQRFYVWSGQAAKSVGVRGEFAVEALISNVIDNALDMLEPGEETAIRDVEIWLKRLGLAASFDLDFSTEKEFAEVKIHPEKSPTVANIKDVGFGVSQLLPVIVQAFTAPPGSIIILEQPEIHLHPAVQGRLADFFIEVGMARRLQFVIESHSEHLLRRFQQRLAENVVQPANIAMYFCTLTETGAKAESLKINKYGEIENWPNDFFGPVQADLLKTTEARIKRRKEEKEKGKQ